MSTSSSEDPPPWIADLIRLPRPRDVPVVPGSTPIISFGDPTTARVATLGLNPSVREFMTSDRRMLEGSVRRLETLASTGLCAGEDLSGASDAQVARVWRGMSGYFRANPYWDWFGDLERVLAGTGNSFSAGTACHLDLAPWATDPKWGSLGKGQIGRLSAAGGPVLRTLLERGSSSAVLINGRGVWRAVERSLGVRFEAIDGINDCPPGCSMAVATGPGNARLLAWSVNLQSSWGVTNAFRARLAARVADWWSAEAA